MELNGRFGGGPFSGAPFVTGGANRPFTSRGNGSLVTGFGSGVEVPGCGENCFCFGKGSSVGGPVTSTGDGSEGEVF